MRPTRETIHMATAFLWADRSTCKRAQRGAIITDANMRRVLSIGYNGPAKQLSNDRCSGKEGSCGCLHAEDNAINFVDSTISDKVIFCTCLPCEMCAQRILNSNITKVYFAERYRTNTAIEIFREADVALIQMVYNQGHIWGPVTSE